MSTTRLYDYIIVGAGPAGLQLGYFFKESGTDHVILEASGKAGDYFTKFPRHDRMLTANIVYSGYEDPGRRLRYDWNSLLSRDEAMLFRNYSQDFLPRRQDFLRYIRDFAEHYELSIDYNTRVTKVSKESGVFLLETNRSDVYQCKRLVIATGVSKPYVPDVPGVEHADNYAECSVDRKDYIDQRVLIVGKGNSAFETANHLIPVARTITVTAPECVTMAWSSHYKGDLRAINSAFIDTYHLKSQNHILNAEITNIEKTDSEFLVDVTYTKAAGQTMRLAYDKIIYCTGFRFDDEIFDASCKPEMVESLRNRFPAFTSEWESVNVEDLYFIGVLMGAKDQKKYFSSFVQGFRANIAVLKKYLDRKYHDVPLSFDEIDLDPENLADLVLSRASGSAALLLQPGFLCDCLVVDDDGAARYYKEINVEHVFNSDFVSNRHYYLLTMEYGQFQEGDPLCEGRDPDPDQAHKDVYIHPILRRYNGRSLEFEHHIPEAIENDWQIFHFVRQQYDMSQHELASMYR
ncbi:MAG: pyridine nucleotide-disulfide oxidoreductase [Proteobacteria bacterium]|nr:MAG: pyridine nucleotide-disulfide oxidoreductase [Pseudomonadota bacterium]